jgi:Phytanoyl-CoA dioxygenase (PhyH)
MTRESFRRLINSLRKRPSQEEETKVIQYSIFREDELRTQFETDGYLVLPLLNPDEVEQMKKIYHELHTDEETKRHTIPSYAKGFYADTLKNERGYRRRVNDVVNPIFKQPLESYFKDFKIFYGGFSVKFPDPESEVRIHQDPTFLDETAFTPINIWCPLQDIDGTKGALTVLKGSHRFHSALRGVSIPSPWQKYGAFIKPYMTPLYMSAGSAVLFSQATFHGSEPNISSARRIVAVGFVSHKKAAIRIAYRNPENPLTIELFAQDDDFIIEYSQFSQNVMAKPEIGRHITSLPYRETSISQKKMLALLESTRRRNDGKK